MAIPVVNLRPSLDATRDDWRLHLAEMFERMQFIQGEQLAAFEPEFAAAVGATYAVGVGNGTDAIGISLRDAGVKGEVLTTAMTAPFTGIAILSSCCTPRFADVDAETLQMDADDAGNRMRKRTSAVVAVHLYGQPCEVDRIAALGRLVVQDACQAHGARYRGRALAEYSTHVAYSFYPTKNLGCLGDGGAIVTRKRTVAERLRMLRDGGRKGGQVSYVAGINSRLDEMQCCYLRGFVSHLGEWNEERRRLAGLYDEALGDCRGVRLVRRTAESVCHLYVIRAAKRDKLREYLASKGVGTGVHYPMPMHLHPAFAACGQKRGDLPVAERAAKEIVSLPLWPGLKETEVAEVVDRMREFYRR